VRLQSVHWLSRFADIIKPADSVTRAHGNELLLLPDVHRIYCVHLTAVAPDVYHELLFTGRQIPAYSFPLDTSTYFQKKKLPRDHLRIIVPNRQRPQPVVLSSNLCDYLIVFPDFYSLINTAAHERVLMKVHPFLIKIQLFFPYNIRRDLTMLRKPMDFFSLLQVPDFNTADF
jgi:hypothetical protein